MHNSNIFLIKDENTYLLAFHKVVKYSHIHCFSDSLHRQI